MAGATRFFFCHQTEFSILSNCLHFAGELLVAVWPALSHPWHPRGNLLNSTSSFAQEKEMLERSFMSMRWTREMFAGKMWNSGKKFNNTLLDKYHDNDHVILLSFGHTLVDCPTQLTLYDLDLSVVPWQIPVRNMREHSREICYPFPQ